MLDFLYTTLGFIWFVDMVGIVAKLYISCLKGESDE
nr:MAG TPA: hypothetical protein [Caudoviricetes sp.]